MIPYGKQNILQEDIEAVIQALTSDFLTQGPRVKQFENAISKKVGAHYAVATNSATSSLHLACLALGLCEGQILWTSPNTFVASANCARYCGAEVDFVDINPHTYNLCPIKLEEKLKISRKNKTLPSILVAVHLAGQSCNMKAIHALSCEYGFKIIEDASHAIGGRYKGEYIGGGQFSDITVFSFHPVKIITCAEGGMALTNQVKLAETMTHLRSHGISYAREDLLNLSEGAWYYEQNALGMNYRMTELQAALGMSQLTRLDSFVKRRKALAKRYHEKLLSLPVILPTLLNECDPSWHLYVIQLKDPGSRRRIFDALRAQQIGVHVHYIPVHTQPYYRQLGFDWGDFVNAENYYHAALSLPLFFDMTNKQQDKVISVLSELLFEKTGEKTA